MQDTAGSIPALWPTDRVLQTVFDVSIAECRTNRACQGRAGQKPLSISPELRQGNPISSTPTDAVVDHANIEKRSQVANLPPADFSAIVCGPNE